MLILSLTFNSISLVAQEETEEKTKKTKEFGGMGFFHFGYNQVDLNSLNSLLSNNGYTKFPTNYLSFGGGGWAVIRNFVIGGQGHGLSGGTVTGAAYSSEIEMGYGFFDLGYMVVSGKNLKVYPVLGLGGGGVTVRINEIGTTPTFDDVLKDPKRSVELSSNGFLTKLEVNFDYILNNTGSNEGNGGFILGLTIGYTYSPSNNGWEMNERDISGGPVTGVNGFYARLKIGGGGFGK